MTSFLFIFHRSFDKLLSLNSFVLTDLCVFNVCYFFAVKPISLLFFLFKAYVYYLAVLRKINSVVGIFLATCIHILYTAT